MRTINIEMKSKMEEIRNIENKYGSVLFGMGLTHLVDVGHRTLDVPYVEESIKQIMAESNEDDEDDSFMSPEFKCEIIRCAAELTRFSPWTLFAFIKEHFHVSS